ncbi:MAG TPA: hypothetical protein VJ623_15995 [Holophagaceae bacterium]|nr:hypothetical protein [Holophagaceae bacterium]
MLEAVQCPKCSTRYGLRSERVKAVHARAQCHSCQGVFPIHDVVARLLALPPKEQPDDATATMGFKVEDLEQLHILPPALPELPEEPVFLEPEAELEPLPEFIPAAESLSADDLLGADSEILEKTLVTAPEPEPVPEIRTSPNLPEPLPEERTASGQEEALPSSGRTTGSYRSAKDAISQLFGETPVAPVSTPRLRKEGSNGAFEMEATLEALENTLGGSDATKAAPLSPAEPEFAAPSNATQRMSLAEMQAAIAAVSMPAEPAAPAAEHPSAQELEASEVTQMMDASRLAKAVDPGATNPVSPLMADIAPASDDPNLLRLRIGDEVYPNLGMDQLIRWVEEGRVIETHLVARQFSENWIEAHKVPGLRPVFERLKKLRAGGPEATPEGTAPIKKSLFGGLFGKKDN